MDIVISRDSFDYLGNGCSHCLEFFYKDDIVLLLVHVIDGKSEGIKQAKKRGHIFHEDCIRDKYTECPFDRYKISSVKRYKYNELITINLIGYSTDYYQLLDSKPHSISLQNVNNINYLDNNGKTLFYCACQRNDEAVITKLIKFGANVNIGDNNFFTPLMVLTCLNHLGSIKKFNRDVVDINAVDSTGNTALDYAVKYGNYAILDYFIRNFNIDKKNISKIYNDIKYIKDRDPANEELLTSIKSMLLNSENADSSLSTNVQIKFKVPEISIYHPVNYTEKPLKVIDEMYQQFRYI